MAYWDAPVEGYPPEHRDFPRVWQKAEQIVFSRTLTRAPTRIARVEREFDRTLEWIASVDYEGCIWIARPGSSQHVR